MSIRVEPNLNRGGELAQAGSVCGARLAIDIHGSQLAQLNSTSQHGKVVNGKKLPESSSKLFDAICVCMGQHSRPTVISKPSGKHQQLQDINSKCKIKVKVCNLY